MTPAELFANGCFTEDGRGGRLEYWLPIECDEQGDVYTRLSVRFDHNPNYGREWMVFICLPHFSFALKHILTIEQFLEMHRLLTGADRAVGEAPAS